MRPAVVTAVLLLLVCILDTVTAQPRPRCHKYPERPCGDGWSRIDDNRCAKYIKTQKTFDDAQEYCRTLNGDLVSLHNDDEMFYLTCLTWDDAEPDETNVWIGAKISDGEFRFNDGSEFDYEPWLRREPNDADGQEDCIESKFKWWGYWNDVRCSKENYFACAKNM